MLRRIRAKGIGIILMMLLCLAMPVQAASPYSLTIDYHYGKASAKIGGATFQVVMVASRDASGNRYTLVDPFTGSDVNPNDVGADVKAQQAAAKSLQRLYKSATDEERAANPATALTTDSNGQAVTGIDTPGLYLIWQSGSKGTASQYYNATPMLVYIPTVNDDGMTWQNDITIEPKTSRRPNEDGGGGNTDSGDTDNPSDTGGEDNPSDTRTEPAKARDTAAKTQPTTKVPTEEITETDETGTEDPAGENASSAEGSTDEGWLSGEEAGSLKGNPDYLGGWISDGGFSGDNSPMRIYAAIAIFALIVFAAHFLRSKRK